MLGPGKLYLMAARWLCSLFRGKEILIQGHDGIDLSKSCSVGRYFLDCLVVKQSPRRVLQGKLLFFYYFHRNWLSVHFTIS